VVWRPAALGTGRDQQLPVGDRLGDGGLLEEPVEEQPAGS
jgi:hypothetical protein